MPAVNLSLHKTHGGITLYQVPRTQLRLLCRVTVTFLGLIFLGVLLFIYKRRYKSSPAPYTSKLDATSSSLQRIWLSEKSRGVVFQSEIMSISRPSGISQLRAAEENSGEQGKKHDWDESEDRDGENGSEEEITASVSIGADTPRMFKPGPPPPPLTPPTLSTGAFTFQDRRLSVAASSMGDMDTNFFQQPNPDYTLSPSSDSTSTALPHSQDSTSIPRRRSYTKVLPLGPVHTGSEHDGPSFPPSSFPSSSPILPLAPHESLESREIDMKGEIISVMDDSGAGWKRHTRVYGGGVCLACLASGSQGGFYGDNVPPEHRR